MNEDFVSFELSKKLKEKGYPQVEKNTLAMYDEDGCLSCLCPTFDINRYYYCFEDFDKHGYVAPTISQVLKWLREEKKIYLELVIVVDAEYMCDIYKIDASPIECLGSTEYSKTYEDAALAGIEYTLDLIMSTTTQTLESIGKAADAFGNMKEMKFSFAIKTNSDGQVRFVNPSFDELPVDLALCIVGALSQSEKEFNNKIK